MEAGTLVRRDDAPMALGEPAYKQFDREKIALIKATVMPPEASDGDLYMLLELSARYGLDPFIRQIWAAKMKGSQGEKGGVVILVGRDGILSIAQRHPDYEGFRSGIVCAKDEFSADLSGPEPAIVHKTGHPSGRGEIVGAWCIAYRRGRQPRYFFAPYEEYVPKSENKLKYSPWGTTRSVMIEKCAITTAHRLQFEITGLYEPDEMAQALVEHGGAAPAGVDYGDDPKLALYLTQLFEAAEKARPGSFLPAKKAALLRDRNDEEKRRGLAAELVEHIERFGGDVPDYPEDADVDEAAPSAFVDEDEVVYEESEPEVVYEPGFETSIRALVENGHDWDVISGEVSKVYGEGALEAAKTVYDAAVAAEAEVAEPEPAPEPEPEEPAAEPEPEAEPTEPEGEGQLPI